MLVWEELCGFTQSDERLLESLCSQTVLMWLQHKSLSTVLYRLIVLTGFVKYHQEDNDRAQKCSCLLKINGGGESKHRAGFITCSDKKYVEIISDFHVAFFNIYVCVFVVYVAVLLCWRSWWSCWRARWPCRSRCWEGRASWWLGICWRRSVEVLHNEALTC